VAVGERVKALKQGGRTVWPFLLWSLAAFAIVAGIWALIYVPKMQVPVCPPDQSGLSSKICFDIENEARRTLAYILGGILAIIGITLAHRRIRALERQVLVAQEGQITERFTRAIEQLGSDKMEIRLGGIYALERIANDSDKDYWPIIETLTAYVRERAKWQEPSKIAKAIAKAADSKKTDQEEFVPSWHNTKIKPATDIQAVLTVLGRRKYKHEQGEMEPLDLRGTDLRGANLLKAHLERVDLSEVHLEAANLCGAYLEGAKLLYAHLEGVNLSAAHLEKASLNLANLVEGYLRNSYMERSNLSGANLKGANLSGAHLEGARFKESNLEGAILIDARLERARFPGAQLKGTHLSGAHLEGVNLKEATGLTRDQLSQAILDEKTILPDYLREQSPQGKGPERSSEE
jgi:uncharacterized protein YjbI with pentapeptide repeats